MTRLLEITWWNYTEFAVEIFESIKIEKPKIKLFLQLLAFFFHGNVRLSPCPHLGENTISTVSFCLCVLMTFKD